MSNGDGLPKGWAGAQLHTLVTPGRERVKPADFADLPFIGLEHVEARTMRLLGTVDSGTMKSSSVHFLPEDVLYGRLRPYLNKVFRPDFEGLCSAEFIVFPQMDAIDNSFLQYRLNSADFVFFASHLDEGDRPRVDFDQIGAFEVKLPPIPEQRRIVAKIEELFSDLDAGVAALERAKAKLKRYRAAVLKAAVEGKLTEEWRAKNSPRPLGEGPGVRAGSQETAFQLLERILKERRRKWEEAQLAAYAKAEKNPPANWKEKYKEPAAPDTTNLPELPESWCWTSIGQCFRVCVGATPSRKQPSYWGGRIPWASSGEVQFCRIKETAEQITEEGLAHSSTQVNPHGSVLIGMIGEGRTRGQVAILDIDACNNQNCAAIWVSQTPMPPEFVYYWLWSQYEVTRRKGSGNNQPALNKTRVEEIPLPLPPLAEQQQIVSDVEQRLSIAQESESQIEANLKRSSRLRQSILKRAFEGKLVPQDPNDEPASVLLERIRDERENGKPASHGYRKAKSKVSK